VNSRTNNVYATILALQTSPTIYIALLDGDGDKNIQQFEVAKNADFLLIVVDHAEGNTKIAWSKKRIEEHDRLLKQLEFTIKQHKQLKHLHIILNKRDLWEKSKTAVELQKWFESHVNHLNKANVAKEITSDVHSNMITSDMGKVIRQITEKAKIT